MKTKKEKVLIQIPTENGFRIFCSENNSTDDIKWRSHVYTDTESGLIWRLGVDDDGYWAFVRPNAASSGYFTPTRSTFFEARRDAEALLCWLFFAEPMPFIMEMYNGFYFLEDVDREVSDEQSKG